MARTSSQNRKRADRCREYRATVTPERCEVKRWIAYEDILKLTPMRVYEVHHIFARHKTALSEHDSALILVDKGVHDWVESIAPLKGQIACLYAKWRKSLKQPSEFDVSVLNELVFPCTSLEGFLVKSLSKLKGTVYEQYARELINEIQNDDIKF